MLDADNIQKLMDNLELVQTVLIDEDIHTLNCTLRAAVSALRYSTLQLANELIGRLRYIKGSQIRSIISRTSICSTGFHNFIATHRRVAVHLRNNGKTRLFS